jgi:hypothetical protein
MPNQRHIALKVNGAPIELNAFAQSIIGNTIEAMVLSLRFEEEPKQIEIIISK